MDDNNFKSRQKLDFLYQNVDKNWVIWVNKIKNNLPHFVKDIKVVVNTMPHKANLVNGWFLVCIIIGIC